MQALDMAAADNVIVLAPVGGKTEELSIWLRSEKCCPEHWDEPDSKSGETQRKH